MFWGKKNLEDFRMEVGIKSAERKHKAYLWKCHFLEQKLINVHPLKYKRHLKVCPDST